MGRTSRLKRTSAARPKEVAMPTRARIPRNGGQGEEILMAANSQSRRRNEGAIRQAQGFDYSTGRLIRRAVDAPLASSYTAPVLLVTGNAARTSRLPRILPETRRPRG